MSAQRPQPMVADEPLVFDSIASIAIRLLRRFWLIATAIAVLVAALIIFRATRSAGVEASQTIFFNDMGGIAERAEAPTDVLDPRGLAIRLNSRGDFEVPVEGVVAVAVGDATAQTLEIRYIGPEIDDIAEASVIATELATDEASHVLSVQLESALGAERTALDDLQTQIDGLNEAVPTLDDTERDVAILSRSALIEELAERARGLTALEAFAETANNSLSVVGPVSTEATGTSPVVILGSLIAGGVMATGLFGIFAASGLVRRRIHLERAAPGTSVVAVIPQKPNEEQQASATRLLTRRVSELDTDTLHWVGLGLEWEESAIAKLDGVPVSATPLASDVPDGAHVIVEVREGKITENGVAELRASLDGYGVGSICWCLSGVPRADLSWASVTSMVASSA